MDSTTVSALARLNSGFYDRFAEPFSRTRQAPWPGWTRVLETWRRLRPVAPAGQVPSILDLGCGNGRFGVWLEEVLDQPHDYTGVDSSARLIEFARATLSDREGGRTELAVADLVFEDLEEHLGGRSFDLITLFGLLHHLPAFARRRALLQDLEQRMAPEGLLALTFWQFADHQRFRRRFLDWEAYNREAGQPIDPADLEEGDFLLRWGEAADVDGPSAVGACRYCHFTAPGEADQLVAALDLRVVDIFRADGADGDLNLYYLLHKKSK